MLRTVLGMVVVLVTAAGSPLVHARALFRGSTVPTGDHPGPVAVSDFDRDGNQDLVYGDYYDLSVVMGDGTGAFQSTVDLPVAGNTTCIGVADFTSDGIEDVIATHPSTGEVSLHRGFGDGTFAMEVPIPTTAICPWCRASGPAVVYINPSIGRRMRLETLIRRTR